MSIQEPTLKQIKELAQQIEGFRPLSEIVPDCIDCERELNLMKQYLWTFSEDLTAANYYQYVYGVALSKK